MLQRLFLKSAFLSEMSCFHKRMNLFSFKNNSNLLRRRWLNTQAERDHLRFLQERHLLKQAEQRKNILSISLYAASVILLVGSFGYGMSPLYKIFCQKTGMGGIIDDQHPALEPEKMVPVKVDAKIKVQFAAHSMNKLPWTFEPLQEFVMVKPGETALAFFKATNPTSRDIKGVATYNIIPAQASPYFVKIQCFCFEEQKLYAGESIDMPVFFYIDPDILLDSTCVGIKDILLAYSFHTSDV